MPDSHQLTLNDLESKEINRKNNEAKAEDFKDMLMENTKKALQKLILTKDKKDKKLQGVQIIAASAPGEDKLTGSESVSTIFKRNAKILADKIKEQERQVIYFRPILYLRSVSSNS